MMKKDAPGIDINGFSASRDLLADLILLRSPYDNVEWERRELPPLRLEWKLHAVSENGTHGYDGALFSTRIDGQRRFFIFHQGTNDPSDLPSLARLAAGQAPQQLADARRFTSEARALIADRFPDEAEAPVVQVGYSLGGPLAAICAEPHEPIITYESPGIRAPLEAANRNLASFEGRLLNVLSPHSNFINSLGEHLGDVLDAGEKYWAPARVSIPNFVDLSIRSHRRTRLHEGLGTLPALEAKTAAEAGRPDQPWDALREYIADHMSERPSVQERLLATTAETIDRLKYDEKFMDAVGKGLNGVLGYLAEVYTRTLGKEKPMTVRTHPQVRAQLLTPSAKGFAGRIADGRDATLTTSARGA